MRIFPEQTDELLDAASLPRTDKTELNYRTRPLTVAQELRLAILVMFGFLPVLIVGASLANGLTGLHRWFENLIWAGLILIGLRLAVHYVMGAHLRTDLVVGSWLGGCYLTGWTWQLLGEVGWCRLAMFVAWLTSCLMARQITAWILVGPTVDYETMTLWRFDLPHILRPRLSLECPELLIHAVSPFLLGPAWWCATQWAVRWTDHRSHWPWFLIIVLHVAWLGLHAIAIWFVPWPNWRNSWRMTIQAVIVFITYDIHRTPAAGVFRFPTRWLRPILARWSLLLLTLLVLAFACAAARPSPWESPVSWSSVVGRGVLNWLTISVQAPLLLITIIWFTSGTLLARFDAELTRQSPSGLCPWDNYLDRIVNSGDDLEREHLLVGTSLVGDYPVLVHQEIYDQHMHILGDSGSSKSSLGMAPIATQLIARGDSTVIVIDLKGDKALFEACRIEAARSRKLRFRWLSNAVGKTSFGFNPFQQSHNQHLSVQQFAQEILQGLSLDYGIAYGAGYFTAMNEIVLTTVLRHCRARSFRELDPYLSSESYYARIGHQKDWSQARHLGALVSRMASTEALNVIPGMYPDQHEVHRQAIDAANLFEEPQVVYFWLRSAIEPSNAPAIARLLLWSLFNAAGHRTSDSGRVYVLIDEIQQVLAEGIKLIFEQFRDLGGTLIAAHQTIAQLKRQGSDLVDTIDSCTAVKQNYRASDLPSRERLEKLSGNRLRRLENWVQARETATGDLIERLDTIHAQDNLIGVRQMEQPRLDQNQIQRISASRLASMIRFTFGSGYTQFAGATVPIISQYPINFEEYTRRRRLPWPTAPGAFVVPKPISN